jgi:hypothetical protein
MRCPALTSTDAGNLARALSHRDAALAHLELDALLGRGDRERGADRHETVQLGVHFERASFRLRRDVHAERPLLESDPDAFETVFDSRRAGFRQTDATAIVEAALTRWQSQSRRKLASFVGHGVRNGG